MGEGLSRPAFGEADLSNCEREQIHLAGSIQPHGALLVVREPDLVVVQASANAAEFLGLNGHPLGRSLAELGGDLLERVAPHLEERLDGVPFAIRCRLADASAEFDMLLHRPPGGGLIVEFERAGPPVDLGRGVAGAIEAILSSSSLGMLGDETARIFQELTGYDRVMVYRFDEQGHGEVFSEARDPGLEAYLGNRYPASDIPQIARRLYERNRVRVLVDMDYAPVPLTPRLSPVTGRDLDMSMCFLRSSSPIHVQYLKNMGVAATLVVSLVVGGKLWGLVACHHYSPRILHFQLRAICDVLAEAAATRIAALESLAQLRSEWSVSRLEQRMAEAVADEGDWRKALFDNAQSLLQPLGATGAALLFDGQVQVVGDVPATHQLRALGVWLDERRPERVFSTATLPAEHPASAFLAPVACGVVAATVSNARGEYLLWFRPEQVRTVTWGGDPMKPFVIGDDPADLSPRRSFAQWHQLVEGTSKPWTPGDLAAARMIADIVSDVIVQLHSVRSLIAQDQLDQVSRRIGQSANPVVTADSRGRIIQTNEAFEGLLKPGHPHIEHLEDLAPFFSGATSIRAILRDLVLLRRAWKGELRVVAGGLEGVPMLVRAEPVFAAPDRTLGFVLLFTDLRERKAAEEARRLFQEGIADGHLAHAARLDATGDRVYRSLLSSIVENAEVAALEIADGEDLACMPRMLDSVSASVARTAEVLEHLVLHATSAPAGAPGAKERRVRKPAAPTRGGERRRKPEPPPTRRY